MPVRASASRTIDTLVGDLSSASGVSREAAVARLTVIGGRAVERLITLSQSNSSSFARIGALHALEAIGDPRALAPALSSARRAASMTDCASWTSTCMDMRGR